MKYFILVLLFTCGAFAQSFVSDVSKVGTTAGEVLAMPASARGLALGNAVGGMSADASVFFWNPALATSVTQTLVSASYLPWLVDTDFQHFSAVIPIRPGWVIGGFVAAWSMDDMKVRTEDYQQGTGQYFDAGDLVLALSTAGALTKRFSIGLNVKYIQERIWHCSAKGFALDFGTVYQTDFLNGMKIITTLNNYGTDMQLDGRDLNILKDPWETADGNNGEIPGQYTTDPWSLPLNFRFGLAADVLKSDNYCLTMEVDAHHPSNNYEAVDIGIEMNLREYFFLRSGISSLAQEDSIEGFSFGAGLAVPLASARFYADYGYRDYGDLGYIQAMTIGIGL